jgi:hypothetical protein
MKRFVRSHRLKTLVLGGMMAAAVIGASAGSVGAQYYYPTYPATSESGATTPYSYGYWYPYAGGYYGYPYYAGYYGYYG